MRIEFDPDKDVANIARHGIYRIISLRKATPKEVRYYASQI